MIPGPGRSLSHYRLEEQIGMGGMGVVWRAADPSLGRRVAIKILPEGFAGDRTRVARFRREAKLLASLNHPNIATIYEIGEDAGLHFIAMELVEGESLRRRLKRGALEVHEAVRIGLEIGEALACAHAARVIHRDLKPDNVMVRPDGHPKVLDFGLARHLAPPGSGDASAGGPSGAATLSEHMTEAGWVVGTAGYMSPEQTRGEELDPRSDIFSFGILLYEMLAGTPPFRGRTKIDTLAAILERPARPVTALRPQVPRDLALCLERCLEKDPAARHRDAGELVRELARIHRGSDSAPTEKARPVSVHGPPPPASPAAHATPEGRARRFRGRHHVAVLLTAGAALAAAFFLLPPELNPPPGEVLAPLGGEAGPAAGRPPRGGNRIVVLPFENLGEAEDATFAAGMADEITTRLASVGGLHVIASASAATYAGGPAPVSRIRDELGVDYILEGKIRWASSGGGGEIRVTPKLVDARDGSVVWAGIFNETASDIFAVQSGIAITVIDHLGVALGEGEREAVEAVPTADMEAYEAYLMGRHDRSHTDYSREGRQRVVDRFARAVELDPGFVPAWVELAQAHAFMYHLGYDRSEERKRKARLAAERARALAPGNPETHLGLGYYHYHVERNYEAALREFSRAREGLPGSTDVLMSIAYVKRRRGQFQEAADLMTRAAGLSPREPGLLSQLGDTLLYVGRFEEAERVLERSIALAPEESYPYFMLVWLHRRQGDLEGSRAVLESYPGRVDPPVRHAWYMQHLLEGDPRAALEWVGPEAPEIIEWGAFFYPRGLLAGFALRLLGESEEARPLFESALATLRSEAAASPSDPRIRLALGLALAFQGMKEEALREGRAGVELNPLSRDAYFAPQGMMQSVWIDALAGEKDAAVRQLQRLASRPNVIHFALLDRDPRYAPLRDHPGFQALVEAARAAVR